MSDSLDLEYLVYVIPLSAIAIVIALYSIAYAIQGLERAVRRVERRLK